MEQQTIDKEVASVRYGLVNGNVWLTTVTNQDATVSYGVDDTREGSKLIAERGIKEYEVKIPEFMLEMGGISRPNSANFVVGDASFIKLSLPYHIKMEYDIQFMVNEKDINEVCLIAINKVQVGLQPLYLSVKYLTPIEGMKKCLNGLIIETYKLQNKVLTSDIKYEKLNVWLNRYFNKSSIITMETLIQGKIATNDGLEEYVP